MTQKQQVNCTATLKPPGGSPIKAHYHRTKHLTALKKKLKIKDVSALMDSALEKKIKCYIMFAFSDRAENLLLLKSRFIFLLNLVKFPDN